MSTTTKIAIAAAIALILPIVLVGGAVGGVVDAVFGASDTPAPSQKALDDIPRDYLTLYQQAATACPGLDWTILAAIGKIESDHGRSTKPGVTPGTENSAGARGDMQFLQPAFDGVIARHTIPAGGANPPSPWNKHDAIYAASFYLCDSMPSRTCPPRERQVRDGNSATSVGKAMYLCDNGARDNRDLPGAWWTYNHSTAYVTQVLDVANAYAAATPAAPGDGATTAIGYAMTQLGLPYVWGGDGPEAGESGFPKPPTASPASSRRGSPPTNTEPAPPCQSVRRCNPETSCSSPTPARACTTSRSTSATARSSTPPNAATWCAWRT